MMQVLMAIDQFGVEQKLQIHAQKPSSKSSIGGIMTIILYGTCLGYFLSEFIDWAENNKLPKITSFQNQIRLGEEIDLKGRFLEITSSYQEQNFIDPFDPEALIFYPIVFEIPGNFSELKEINSEMEILKLDNGRIIYNFFLQDKQIKGSPPNKGQTKNFLNYYIILAYCDQIQKEKGLKCANSSIIDQFTAYDNFIAVTFYITSFNPKTKQLYQFPKTYEVNMQQDHLQFYQYNLQPSALQVNDGILFSNLNDYIYVSDFQLSISYYNQNQSLAAFGKKSQFWLYLTMDQIKNEVSLEYPNISEILANTGSIITWILQISFFVSKYNQKIFSQQTIKDIIRIYYPDIDELIIEKQFLVESCVQLLKINNTIHKKSLRYLEICTKQRSRNSITIIYNMKYQGIKLKQYIRIQLILTETLGINYVKKHMFSEGSIQEILDSLNHTSSKSLIQINQSNQKIHQIQLQDSQNQDLIHVEPEKQAFPELIRQSLGLLMKQKEEIKEEIEEQKPQNQERAMEGKQVEQ